MERGVIRNQMLGVGEGWKKFPPPPHCHFKWKRPYSISKYYQLVQSVPADWSNKGHVMVIMSVILHVKDPQLYVLRV